MSSFIEKCVKEFMNEKFMLYMFKRGIRGSNNYVSNVMIRAMLSGRKIITLKNRGRGLTFMVEKDKDDSFRGNSFNHYSPDGVNFPLSDKPFDWSIPEASDYGSVKKGLNKEDLEDTLNVILDGQKSRMKYFGFYENMSAENKIEFDKAVKKHIALSGRSKTQR